MASCLCVFFHICPELCSKLGETPISTALLVPAVCTACSRQYEETWLILGWSLLAHPVSHFPSFLLALFLCALVICLCPWFPSLDWLTWESQWHRCPQAKTRLDEQRHTFLPLSAPRWVPPPYDMCGHISVYQSLEMLTGCLYSGTSVYSSDAFITFIFSFFFLEKHAWDFLSSELTQSLRHSGSKPDVESNAGAVLCANIVIHIFVMHIVQRVSSVLLCVFLHFPEFCQTSKMCIVVGLWFDA